MSYWHADHTIATTDKNPFAHSSKNIVTLLPNVEYFFQLTMMFRTISTLLAPQYYRRRVLYHRTYATASRVGNYFEKQFSLSKIVSRNRGQRNSKLRTFAPPQSQQGSDKYIEPLMCFEWACI